MTVGAPARIAVVGAGLIGRRHIEEIVASDDAELAAVVDPGPAAAALAERYSVALHTSVSDMLDAGAPDGVILATPNQLHVEGGLECVAAGVPVIVEKPVGHTVQAATTLVEAAERAGVPLLTGHHRNYSPIMIKARQVVSSGELGAIVAVVGTALFYKPDDYFLDNGGWRTRPGGGPILLNLIHDVNNLLSLAGDIVTVQAATSNAVRGFAVEDTAAMVFTFAGGALGTFAVSDTAASPRSWEQTSGENRSYDRHADQDCYHIAGTRGSLSVPTMRRTVFPGRRSWWEPMQSSVLDVEDPTSAPGGFRSRDPLANQVSHFVDVIRGTAVPICSGRDGLRALMVVEAVQEAARTGAAVTV